MDEVGSWFDAYERVCAGRSISTVPCPTCGARTLRLVFLVDGEASSRATFVFWCDSCLTGLLPAPAAIPTGFAPTLRGTEEIPDFRVLAERPS
jgi:hypothetical protein